MSITSLQRSLLLALAATLLLAPSARAIDYDHEFVPFIDPLQFNPDFQFFAPAELGDFGREPDPNTGWFADYKRSYMLVSRPERERRILVELPSTSADWTWGNVWDVGYMTEDGTGWWFSGIHVGGPNKFDVFREPRINRVEEDDIDPDDDPIFPIQDRNNVENFGRYFDTHNSINVAKYSQFEANKVWRLDQLHSGGTIEPFLGFRYGRFHDQTRRDQYNRLDEFGVSLPLPSDAAVIEEFASDVSYWNNDMFGGHLGVRYTERKSRWLLSSELRLFAQQNFQDFSTRLDVYRILYDEVGNDADTIAERFFRSGSAAHDSEFVYGVDVRAEAAFELTRDINIVVGAQVLHFAQGIARGNTPFHNNEDLQMAGATFGFQLNR